MAKKKLEIKPICAERLKELCKVENITQNNLSKLTLISENTISRIMNGKSPVSHPIASAIHDVFNGYSIEWLMGDSEYQDDMEKALAPVATAIAGIQFKKQAFSFYANMFGYTFKYNNPSKYSDLTIGQIKKSCNKTEIKKDLFENIGKGQYTVYHYDIEIGKISESEYSAIINEVADFADFRLSKLCKNGGYGNGND